MVAVLQVCSDAINKELNETEFYNFTDNKIFEVIKEARPQNQHLLDRMKTNFNPRLHQHSMKLW